MHTHKYVCMLVNFEVTILLWCARVYTRVCTCMCTYIDVHAVCERVNACIHVVLSTPDV